MRAVSSAAEHRDRDRDAVHRAARPESRSRRVAASRRTRRRRGRRRRTCRDRPRARREPASTDPTSRHRRRAPPRTRTDAGGPARRATRRPPRSPAERGSPARARPRQVRHATAIAGAVTGAWCPGPTRLRQRAAHERRADELAAAQCHSRERSTTGSSVGAGLVRARRLRLRTRPWSPVSGSIETSCTQPLTTSSATSGWRPPRPAARPASPRR